MKRNFYSLLSAAVLVSGLTLASHHALAEDAAPAAPAPHSKHKHHHHAMQHNSAGKPVEGRLNDDMSSPDHGFSSNNAPTGTGANGRGGNEWHDSMERNREMQHREVKREEAPQAKHHERHHAKHKQHHKKH